MEQHILFQRIESLVLFLVSTYLYFDFGYSLLVYLLLLFVFDISMIGYFKNAKVGAYIYNLGHTLSLPLIVMLTSIIIDNEAGIGLSLIWLSHIGLDRFLGYGLKLTSGFKETHLGPIGKA